MPIILNTDTGASNNNDEPFHNTEAGGKKKVTFLLHNTRVALAENTQVKRFAYKASFFFLIKNTLQRLHPSFFFSPHTHHLSINCIFP